MLEIQTLRLFIKEIDNDENEGKLLFIAFIDELSNFLTAFVDVFDGENIQEIVENINESLKNFFLMNYPIKKIRIERTETINENNFEMLATFIDWTNFVVNPLDITLVDDDENDEYIRKLFVYVYKKLRRLDRNYYVEKNQLLSKLSFDSNHYLFANKYNIFIMNNIVNKIVHNFNNQEVMVKAGFDTESKLRLSRIEILQRISRKMNHTVSKVFGDFELAINVINNKLGLYAVEKHSKLWFTYANEFDKEITMYDISIAFNLFFDFIQKNKLPLETIQLVITDAFNMFNFFKDEKFSNYIQKHISLENIIEVPQNDLNIILCKKTLDSINELLLSNHIKIGQYSKVANDLDNEYYDVSGNFIKCTPKQYVKLYLKKNIVN